MCLTSVVQKGKINNVYKVFIKIQQEKCCEDVQRNIFSVRERESSAVSSFRFRNILNFASEQMSGTHGMEVQVRTDVWCTLQHRL